MHRQYLTNNLKLFELAKLMVSTLKSILFSNIKFTVKLAEFDVLSSQNGIAPFFPLSQSSIAFLFPEFSTNYILIQKIIGTGMQYGITSCKSIQALPYLWWKGCFKTLSC